MASSASKPLIGISTYLERTRFGLWDVEAAVLYRGYLDGVVKAGGNPVMLPPVGDWTPETIGFLDGLVIAGGADVDPAAYGAEPHPIDRRAAQRPGRLGVRARRRRAEARPAGARRVPGHAGAQRGARRHAAPAHRGPQPGARRVRAHRHRGRAAAPSSHADPGRSHHRAVPSPPVARPDRRRARGSPRPRPTGRSRRWSWRARGSSSGCSRTRSRTSRTSGCSKRLWKWQGEKRDLRRHQPGYREGGAAGSAHQPRRDGRGDRRTPTGRSRRGGTSLPAIVRGCCAGSRSSWTPPSRSSPQLEVENSGHTIGNARWEAGNVRDVLQYYSAAPERLFGKQIPVAGGLNVTFHEPLGVVGVIVPWNFPMPIAGWGFAPALAAGQHGRAQARRAHAADRDPARRAGAGGGHPGGRVPGAAGQGLGRRQQVRHASVGAQGRLHRVDRGRQADHGRLRGPGEAGDAGAGRQVGEHRLRRLRPGEGRGHGAVRGVRQRRTGLLRAVAHPRAGERLRQVHGAAGAGCQGI